MSPLIRKNLVDLTAEEKDNLIKAFAAVKELDPSDEDSFFTISSYHGIPGGFWCHHGDVLFPTWHRAYLNRLERSLQKQVLGVTIPYWDEVASMQGGIVPIPTILTDETYTFSNGTAIPNPLFSYTLQQDIADDVTQLYTKQKGYETVRYPFSGLMTDGYREKTQIHNQEYKNMGSTTTTAMLNGNVATWLLSKEYTTSLGKKLTAGAKEWYQQCLSAPNYTVFSNTTSASAWNKNNPGKVVYPVEQLHNVMHLAVGGIQVPGQDAAAVDFANGDMGENETAAFDPIFYFHHCFIDYTFWNWQVLNKSTDTFEFIAGDPGVVDYTLQTPLQPFKTPDGTRDMTSQDVVNIANLGYSYASPEGRDFTTAPIVSAPRLKLPTINRGRYKGSFVVSTWLKNDDDTLTLVNAHPVLSRWETSNCENCRERLDVSLYTPLLGWSKKEAEDTHADGNFLYKIHTRLHPGGHDGPLGDGENGGIELETEGFEE